MLLLLASGLVATGASGQGRPSVAVAPEVYARVAAEGLVPVIVTLRVPPEISPVPLETLTDDERRRVVRMVQDALIAEVSAVPVLVTQRFEFVPQVALQVTTDSLFLLAGSPYVVTVALDTLSAPDALKVPSGVSPPQGGSAPQAAPPAPGGS